MQQISGWLTANLIAVDDAIGEMTVRRVISQVAQKRRFAYARLPVKFHRRQFRQRLQRRLGFGGAVQQPAKRSHARPHGGRARARLCRHAVVNQAAFRRADLQPHGAMIVARRDDVAGGDARQLLRALRRSNQR